MIFAVACGAETEMFRADVPIEAQHRSMILAVATTGTATIRR